MVEQGVCHPDPMGFHWMSLAVVVVPYFRIVEVAYLALRAVGTRRLQGVSAGIHDSVAVNQDVDYSETVSRC